MCRRATELLCTCTQAFGIEPTTTTALTDSCRHSSARPVTWPSPAPHHSPGLQNTSPSTPHAKSAVSTPFVSRTTRVAPCPSPLSVEKRRGVWQGQNKRKQQWCGSPWCWNTGTLDYFLFFPWAWRTQRTGYLVVQEERQMRKSELSLSHRDTSTGAQEHRSQEEPAESEQEPTCLRATPPLRSTIYYTDDSNIS